MALARWQAPIVDEYGNLIQQPTIEIRRESDGALANLFEDRGGTIPLGNPFTLALSDNGFAVAHAVGGAYRIKITKGTLSRTLDYVAIGTAAESDVGGLTQTARGPWSAASTYAKNDLVEYGGFLFLANADGNTGHQPQVLPVASDAYWTWVGTAATATAVDAAGVAFTPGGNLSATDVQAALIELDADKGGVATANSWSVKQTFNGGLVTLSALAFGAAEDAVLARDAANILAQRNGANSQIFRIYDAYTDASNYRRLAFFANPYALRMMTEESGTYAGAPKRLEIGTSGGAGVYIYTSNAARWQVDANGHLMSGADNYYDIGASASGRPRNINAAGNIISGSYVQAATQFFTNGFLAIGDGIAVPVTVAGRAQIYVDIADGDLKVKFGDGVVKTIATDT